MNRRSASVDADPRNVARKVAVGSTALATTMASRRRPESSGPGGEDVEDDQPTPNLERLVADAMYMAAATGGAGPELANLVNRYWRLVPDEDLAGRTAPQMLAATRAHLELARQRLPGELRIAVEQTADRTALQIVTDDMPFLVDSVTAAITAAGHRPGPVRAPAGRGPPGNARCADRGATRHRTGRSQHRRVGGELDAGRGRRRCTRTPSYPACATRSSGCSPTSGRRSRTGPGCAPGLWNSPTNSPRAVLPGAGEGHHRLGRPAALAVRRPLHLPGLPGVPPGRHGEVLEAVIGTGLGILRRDPRGPRELSSMSPEAYARVMEKRLLIITKANSRSTVHRSAYLDYIGFKIFDADGKVVGERRFLGLFSSAAYLTSVRDLPVVQRKVAEVLDAVRAEPAQPLRQGPAGRSWRTTRATSCSRSPPTTCSGPCWGCCAWPAAGRSAVRPQGPVRAVRLLPGLPAPGPVHHREPAADPGDPAARAQRRRGRLHHPGQRVDAGPAPLHRAHRPDQARLGEIDAEALSGADRRGDPAVGRRLPRSPLERQASATRRPASAGPLLRARSRTATRTPTRAHEATPGPVPCWSCWRSPDSWCCTCSGAARSTRDVRFKVFRYGEPMMLSEVLPVLHSLGVRVAGRAAVRGAPHGRHRSTSTTSG